VPAVGFPHVETARKESEEGEITQVGADNKSGGQILLAGKRGTRQVERRLRFKGDRSLLLSTKRKKDMGKAEKGVDRGRSPQFSRGKPRKHVEGENSCNRASDDAN